VTLELLGSWAPWRSLKVTRTFVLVILSLAALVPLGGARAQTSVPPEQAWQTFRTPHFEVVFAPGLEALARHAARRGEAGLATLEARGFGMVPRDRIQLVVSDHLDVASGLAGVIPYPRIVVGTMAPVHGMQAMPFEDWLDFVVLHELFHIVHLEMTGTLGRAARAVFGRVPLAFPFFPSFALPSWALEGVAVHGETEHTGAGRLHGTRFASMLHARALLGTPDRLDQAMGASPLFPGGERPYVGGGAFFHHLAEEGGTEGVDRFFHRQATRLNPLRLNASARDAFGMTLTEAHAAWVRHITDEARALESGVRARAEARAAAGEPPLPQPRFLTRGARMAAHPVLLTAAGAHAQPGPATLVWMQQDGGSQLRLHQRPWAPAPAPGSDSVEELTSRAMGPRLHTLSPLSVGPDGALWTAQLEAVDRTRIRGELWRLRPNLNDDPPAGTSMLKGLERVRHARGARISQADVHPGHGRLVAVVEVPGTNTLAVGSPFDEALTPLLPASPGVHWTSPRWAPDGARVAAVRWRSGGYWAVGVLTLDPAEARAGDPAEPPAEPRFDLVAEGRAPIHGVTWTADGMHLIWSWEATGVANLHAAAVDQDAARESAVRQITDLPVAAHFPTVIGQNILFSLLGADGWDLVEIPFDPSRWFEPLPTDPRFHGAGEGAHSAAHSAAHGASPPTHVTSPPAYAESEVRPWSPWPTLRPRHWLPQGKTAVREGDAQVLAPILGFQSWGRDAVGRHTWSASAQMPLSGPSMRWEGNADWQWAGAGDPVVTARVSRSWASLGEIRAPTPDPGANPPPFYLASLEQTTGVSVGFLRPRLSSATGFSLGARTVRETIALLEAGGEPTSRARLTRPVRNIAEASVAAAWTSVLSTPMAPGPQSGTSAQVRLRSRVEPGLPDSLQGRPGVGGDARRDDLLVALRHFAPLPLPGGAGAGGAPAVLSLRAAGGTARGPGAGPGTWGLGGGSGDATRRIGVSWDRVPGVFQVRGWPEGVLRGQHVWGAGGEVRVPVAILHRGVGVLPLYVDRLAVSAWADAAGRLDDPGRETMSSSHRVISATGVEGVLLHGAFTWQPDIVRLGVAWPLHGDPARDPGQSFYAAFGWSF